MWFRPSSYATSNGDHYQDDYGGDGWDNMMRMVMKILILMMGMMILILIIMMAPVGRPLEA